MSKMREAEAAIEEACAKGEIPGLALGAMNREGEVIYSRAWGTRSVRNGADQSPLEYDAVHWIASCTKLITSIAAMQCVERGLLSLDAGIYDVLPEFKGKEIITGFNKADGAPILQPHRKTLTLRHLLTHSSGLAYDEVHPKLQSWLAYHGRKSSRASTIAERFSYPLVFEPGDSWCYGAGIDWAGKMVERVNGGMTLQEYFERNIFVPLGVEDIVFSPYLKDRPGMVRQAADISKRDQDDPTKVKRSNAWLQYMGNEDCFGGLGCWASPREYLKVLQGLLVADEDEVLLKKASVEEFFKPSLSPKAREALHRTLQVEEVNNAMGAMPQKISKDHGLGGMVNLDDVAGARGAGSMNWGGMANWIWWVDRKSGLCGVSAAQLLPPGDQQVIDLTIKFEKGLYERYKKSVAKL